MNIDLKQAILALSETLDLAGLENRYHSKRVAYTVYHLAEELGLGHATVSELLDAALLHDCGISSTREHHALHSAFCTTLPCPETDLHCMRGFGILSGFSRFAHLAEGVLHHHTPWFVLKELALPERVIIIANLIHLADRVDALTPPDESGNCRLAQREHVLEEIEAERGRLFAPAFGEAFRGVCRRESFWIGMDAAHLRDFLRERLENGPNEWISGKEAHELARLFSHIVDSKSPFTVEHSSGVARVSRVLADAFGLDENDCERLEVASHLHDLGKLRVPDQILEKPGPLSWEERLLIMSHPFHSGKILGMVKGLEEVARWAAFHHEQPSGNGYPYHRAQGSLEPQAKILAVADVFQALAQERPYRASMEPDDILVILKEDARAGRLEGEMVELIGSRLEAVWLAATHPGDDTLFAFPPAMAPPPRPVP